MRVTPGSTDVSTFFVLRQTSNSLAKTGATITDIDLQYCRTGENPSAKVDATALAATDSAHADNKAIEIDATDQKGLYRVDWPDAAFASGVREVTLTVTLADCFTEHLRIVLETPSTLVVLPLAGSPSSSGRIEPIKITAYQHTKILATLTVLDSSGDPVDLSAKTLALCAWDKDTPATTVITMRTDGEGPELTIGGANSNVVTVTGGVTHTATARQVDWGLYNLTDSTVALVGVLKIEEGASLPT